MWLGFAESENKDAKIKFLQKTNSNVYFPNIVDTCWVQFENAIYINRYMLGTI